MEAIILVITLIVGLIVFAVSEDGFLGLIAAVFVFTILSVAACVDDDKETTQRFIYPEENAILKQMDRLHNCQRYDLVWEAIDNRKELPPRPFCDILPTVNLSEVRTCVKTKYEPNLEQVYYSMHKKHLEKVCSLPLPIAKPVKLTVDKESKISPAILDMVIDSAKTCNKARHKLLDLKEASEKELLEIVVDCKEFQLEQELQKVN